MLTTPWTKERTPRDGERLGEEEVSEEADGALGSSSALEEDALAEMEAVEESDSDRVCWANGAAARGERGESG